MQGIPQVIKCNFCLLPLDSDYIQELLHNGFERQNDLIWGDFESEIDNKSYRIVFDNTARRNGYGSFITLDIRPVPEEKKEGTLEKKVDKIVLPKPIDGKVLEEFFVFLDIIYPF